MYVKIVENYQHNVNNYFGYDRKNCFDQSGLLMTYRCRDSKVRNCNTL